MALSKSALKAQDIVMCQLCELDPKLKWRCMECELLMCSRCYGKIHPKFKNAKDHHIIDIKDVKTYVHQSAQPDFTRIKCNQHETTACCLYCTSCELLVCPICISQGHKGHNFVEISECYREKIEQLKETLKTIDIHKEEIAKQNSEIAKKKSDMVQKGEKVRKAIQDNLQAWRKAGEKYTEKLSGEVASKIDEINKTLSTREAKLKQSKDEVLQTEKISLEFLENQNASYFFENIGAMLESIKATRVEKPSPIATALPKFTPANISQDVFGTLAETLEENIVKNMELRVRAEFTTGLRGCHEIATSGNGLVWISNEISSKVVSYKINDTALSKLKTFHTKVFNLQHYLDNDVLIADGTSTLKIIQGENGKIKEFKCDASQLLIIAVHVTEDNRIVVGAESTEEGNFFKKRQVVIRMDSQGNKEKTWEMDENNKKIFTCPRSLSTTNEGNIFVTDVLPTRFDSRIVVLKNDGGVLNTYSGHQGVSMHGHVFFPTNMKKTPSNNIILCEQGKHVLHLLNNAGNFLRYFDMKAVGVYEPCCIAFCSSETMFIGTNPNSGKGKLYQLEFSETL